jgi:hypothetical protein
MRLFLASLLFATACSSAYADQPLGPQAVAPPGPRTALAIAPEKTRAPYDVQVITEDGDTAPTYALKGRFYVQGNLNERYTIRVTNPTARRVEAVVTVDGLDVADGEAGDLNKRGYIVPAYGETRIEGFRTSLADVATFRFSSVDNSYAGRKGKARNVGVIAVAIFEEQAPPPEQQIIVGDRIDREDSWRGRGGWDAPAKAPDVSRRDRVSTGRGEKRAAAAEEAPSAAPGHGGGGGRIGGAVASRPAPMPHPPPPPPPPHGDFEADEGGGDWNGRDIRPPQEQTAPRTNRPGLGTEFGEQRYSAASYTKFVRAPGRPIAIAELRYNDVAGLMALGLPVQPLPDDGEIMMRETADPFPGDRFARPPGR